MEGPDDLMTTDDVARELGRGADTVRKYGREEGLMFRRDPKLRRLVIRREDFLEWRDRPEIQAMLSFGETVKGNRPRRAVATLATAAAALTTVAFATA